MLGAEHMFLKQRGTDGSVGHFKCRSPMKGLSFLSVESQGMEGGGYRLDEYYKTEVECKLG